MNAIITAATIFTMYFNAAKTTTAGGEYYYNADIQDNKVCTMSVYHEGADKMLSTKIKYDFTYDAQNRLVCKEAYKWDAVMDEWSHYYRMNFSYTGSGYDIVMTTWNSRTKAYDMVREKYVYGIENNDVTYISKYKWNDKSNEFVFIGNMLSAGNDKSSLMAKRPDFIFLNIIRN